jgi:hypothetical protein
MGNKNIFTYLIYNLQIKTTNFHTINLENEDTQVYEALDVGSFYQFCLV